MVAVNVYDAKTNLSRLLDRALAGEEVVIARAGTPLVRLVPVEGALAARVWGHDEGRLQVPDDFDAPLPDEVLRAFYGGEPPAPVKGRRRRAAKAGRRR